MGGVLMNSQFSRERAMPKELSKSPSWCKCTSSLNYFHQQLN